jgi:hypothetical protein
MDSNTQKQDFINALQELGDKPDKATIIKTLDQFYPHAAAAAPKMWTSTLD